MNGFVCIGHLGEEERRRGGYSEVIFVDCSHLAFCSQCRGAIMNEGWVPHLAFSHISGSLGAIRRSAFASSLKACVM